MYNKIKDLLNSRFVLTEDFSRIMALALSGNKNAIIFGPAGHGKSEMTQLIIDGLGLKDETFFQFFGEGMDEARLFGGLNFKKLDEEKVLEYHPERSFLNYRIAIFEELFDAPATVLLALKDTLTAKMLRNGSQQFPMKTETIICLTNHEPQEISDLGPAAQALVERFPLQLNLKWKQYHASDYLAMFCKVSNHIDGPSLGSFAGVLAEIIAKATLEGNFISPRTAMHAYQIIQTAAKMRNDTSVDRRDLIDLRYVPGLEALAETLEHELDAAADKANAESQLAALETEYHVMMRAEYNTPIKCLQLVKKLSAFRDKVINTRVTDTMVERRSTLRDAVTKAIDEFTNQAITITYD